MTRDEIMKMGEGPEMDALIAEKVMGWHIASRAGRKFWNDKDNHYMAGMVQDDEKDFYGHNEDFHIINWHPSQSILWAWYVVDALMEDSHNGLKFELRFYSGTWHCDFGQSTNTEITADTAPLAICRAALLVTIL